MKEHVLIENGAADSAGLGIAMHTGYQQIEIMDDSVFGGATVTIEQSFFGGSFYQVELAHSDNTSIPIEVTVATNQIAIDSGERFGYSLRVVITGGDGTTSINARAMEAL